MSRITQRRYFIFSRNIFGRTIAEILVVSLLVISLMVTGPPDLGETLVGPDEDSTPTRREVPVSSALSSRPNESKRSTNDAHSLGQKTYLPPPRERSHGKSRPRRDVGSSLTEGRLNLNPWASGPVVSRRLSRPSTLEPSDRKTGGFGHRRDKGEVGEYNNNGNCDLWFLLYTSGGLVVLPEGGVVPEKFLNWALWPSPVLPVTPNLYGVRWRDGNCSCVWKPDYSL